MTADRLPATSPDNGKTRGQHRFSGNHDLSDEQGSQDSKSIQKKGVTGPAVAPFPKRFGGYSYLRR